jgi:hypothetical protein
MYKLLGMFFEEVWSHRQNRFIAVGGAAGLSLFMTMALVQVPWIPDFMKSAAGITTGALALATILMMVYYVLKFVWLGLFWMYKKAVSNTDAPIRRG